MGSTPLKGSYSASRVSAVIGLNQYTTPLHIFQILKEEMEPGWNEKHGYTLPEFQDSAALRWGSAFEDAVIKLAEESEGVEFCNREELYKKTFIQKESSCRPTTDTVPPNFTLSCHVDAKIRDGEFFEGKTTNVRAFYTIKEEIEEAIEKNGQILKGFKDVRRWGEPGTDQVPLEYQIQAAVQRICTGADLVKLSVLVFPKTTDEFEELGWRVFKDDSGNYYLKFQDEDRFSPDLWADVFSQIGNFHTYLLPRHEALESKIIKAVQEFHENHVLTGLPPKAQNYDDIKRLLSHPQGTIVTDDDDLREKCRLYSELVRQTGKKSPNELAKKKLKVEIMNTVNELERDSWIDPANKISVLDANGGDELCSFSEDKNGKLTFRARRA